VRESIRRPMQDFVVLALLGVALTWPLLRSPSETLPDAWFAFTQTWTLEVLADGLLRGRLVGPTDLLAWPHGGYLAVVGWSYLPWLLLLRGVGLGCVAAVNTGIWLQLVLAAFLCATLLRRLGAGRGAALVAGAIYGFHPFSFHQLAYGQFSELCHWGLPAVALLLPRALERWRPWTTAAYGLLFGLVLASSPYAGIGAMLLSILLGLWWLVRATRGERAPGALRLAVAALASFVGSLPFLLYYFVLPRGHELLLLPNALGRVGPQGGDFITASLAGWLVPARFFGGATPAPEGAVGLAHAHPLPEHAIGLVTLLVIIAASLWAREAAKPTPGRPGRGFWLLTVLTFWVVSSGWSLPLYPGSGITLPAPLSPLWNQCQSFFWFAAPYRLTTGVLLGVSVLAGLSLSALQARLGAVRGQTLLGIVLALALVESVLASSTARPLPLMEVRAPTVYHDLAELEDGAVLTIPWWPTLDNPKPDKLLFWQTIHGHPLHHGEGARPPVGHLHEIVYEILVLRDEARPTGTMETGPPATWLVLHQAGIPRHQLSALTTLLHQHATLERSYPGEGIELYRMKMTEEGP
jgi:hypothetical protein